MSEIPNTPGPMHFGYEVLRLQVDFLVLSLLSCSVLRCIIFRISDHHDYFAKTACFYGLAKEYRFLCQ